MSGELIRWGSRRPTRDGIRAMREVEDGARVVAKKMQATVALTEYAMEGATEIDDTRRSLAGSDPVRQAILADLEQTGVYAIKKILLNMNNEFGLEE